MIQHRTWRISFASGAGTAALALVLCAPVALPAPLNEAAVRPVAEQGMAQLMNGEPDAAIALFKQVEQGDPSSPLGYILEADALWWKIYYSTANLIDPDVFDVVTSYHTPYDAAFERLIQTAIQKSEANIHAKQDVARNNLYEGMSYALEARLQGLRAHDLATARAGKKMRSLLLTALQLDPKLTDAYAGIGLYNYFVDTLPAIVKMLRFLIGLPGGNRAFGIEQMQKAAQSGDFTRAEAKFYLAKDYTRRNEMQFSKALDLFQQLASEYPKNPLWQLMVGSCHMRLGQARQGESLYRQALDQSANGKSFADQAVHSQVVQALRRLHPQERIR
ncbi:MAG: tetratricopeptide repeat protein [Terriglobia bacterium]